MILVKFIILFEIYNFKVNELIIIGIYRLKKKWFIIIGIIFFFIILYDILRFY